MIITAGPNNDQQRRLTPGARRMISTYITSETLRKRLGLALPDDGGQVNHLRRSVRVEQLAGGIAHHFNNILTAVIGYGSLVQDKMEQDNPLRTYVEYMLSSSEMAADLTKKLLAYSGQQRMNPSVADLNEIVRGAQRLPPLFANKSIQLHMKLTSRRLPVMVDVACFEEVLVNLISNAVDAMPDGGALTVVTDRLQKGGCLKGRYDASADRVLLAVADTGTGMTKATKRQAFDPFFTTKEVGKGTGLGLSIAQGIVRQHGGNIDIESRVGEGTKVTVYLPLAKPRT
jgi:signal transduction histidine kinase